jgi:hypothetical protein
LAVGQRREIGQYDEPWFPGLPSSRIGIIIEFFQLDGIEAVESDVENVGKELEATQAEVLEMKNHEAVRTPSGRVVGDCNGKLHHVWG